MCAEAADRDGTGGAQNGTHQELSRRAFCGPPSLNALGYACSLVLAHTNSDDDDPVPSSYLASKGIKRKARRAQTCGATTAACTAVLGTRCLVCVTPGVFTWCEASDDEAVGRCVQRRGEI